MLDFIGDVATEYWWLAVLPGLLYLVQGIKLFKIAEKGTEGRSFFMFRAGASFAAYTAVVAWGLFFQVLDGPGWQMLPTVALAAVITAMTGAWVRQALPLPKQSDMRWAADSWFLALAVASLGRDTWILAITLVLAVIGTISLILGVFKTLRDRARRRPPLYDVDENLDFID